MIGEREAQLFMIAVSGILAMQVTRSPNTDMYLECVREVLPAVENCPLSLVPVRTSISELVKATNERERSAAIVHLKQDLAKYFEDAAGTRWDAWREIRDKNMGAA